MSYLADGPVIGTAQAKYEDLARDPAHRLQTLMNIAQQAEYMRINAINLGFNDIAEDLDNLVEEIFNTWMKERHKAK